jgi:Flp pilus assembly protein TadD
MPIKASRARQSRSRNTSAPVNKSVATQLQQDSFQDTQTQSSITLRTPDPKQQLALDFRQAANIAVAGQDITAINMLENILASDSSHHQARLLLASLYIRQQRNMNAESVLTAGLERFPQHAPYAHLQAQLLVSRERFTEAITLLNTALPGATSDAGYHALLAGLLQRTGKPANAARHYTTALRLAPGHGEWWMGLGISQEQAGNHIAAQTAYQQALQHPLKSTLLKYINHRMQQLPAQLNGSRNPDNSHGKV